MLRICFRDSANEAIIKAYPKEYIIYNNKLMIR